MHPKQGAYRLNDASELGLGVEQAEFPKKFPNPKMSREGSGGFYTGIMSAFWIIIYIHSFVLACMHKCMYSFILFV